MNPIRLIVYGISWLIRWYQDIKHRASGEFITINREHFRD